MSDPTLKLCRRGASERDRRRPGEARAGDRHARPRRAVIGLNDDTTGGAGDVSTMSCANSDVLPAESVAVALMSAPGPNDGSVAVKLPFAAGVTDPKTRRPRRTRRVTAGIRLRIREELDLGRVRSGRCRASPTTVTWPSEATAEVSTGKFS